MPQSQLEKKMKQQQQEEENERVDNDISKV